VAKVNQNLLDAEAPDDWPKIVALRNMLAHQYADLDQEILQNTIDTGSTNSYGWLRDCTRQQSSPSDE